MLIQVGFRPNNLFITNSTKHYTISSPLYVQMSHHQYHNSHHNHHHHHHHHHHQNNNNNANNSHPNGKHDLKHFQAFLNCRKKKMKKSVMVPCQESGDGCRATGGVVVGGGGGGGGSGGTEGKTPISKCLDTIENDLIRLGKHQSLNPFKNLKIRKEGGGLLRGKTSKGGVENGDGNTPPSSTRLAIEFPMIVNVGSIYSSHVVLYLDP